MTWKTNSGNQAVYSYQVVKELTSSPQVKELFAIAKYGCCCCLEERTWIAALRMLGYGQEGMQSPSMFQIWGGKVKCTSSVRNSVLSTQRNMCYMIGDATTTTWDSLKLSDDDLRRNSTTSKYTGKEIFIRGSRVWDALAKAKREGGFLFCRKFDSNLRQSKNLLSMIQRDLHEK
eukprot:CAMPEP_0116837848 /NCGR_PEP_ID=MMETSP0418-20121206/8880_1 /TAXON_ID=1158023 /ORGANISM="Astrosyne radiata, Strain 13vi08-1A" /LENGTH=174 /DNA_ID=CAMNT_0004467775 /DNA_START=56 /DNA_END=580 /DNA_ORIENTATION=-